MRAGPTCHALAVSARRHSFVLDSCDQGLQNRYVALLASTQLPHLPRQSTVSKFKTRYPHRCIPINAAAIRYLERHLHFPFSPQAPYVGSHFLYWRRTAHPLFTSYVSHLKITATRKPPPVTMRRDSRCQNAGSSPTRHVRVFPSPPPPHARTHMDVFTHRSMQTRPTCTRKSEDKQWFQLPPQPQVTSLGSQVARSAFDPCTRLV